MHVDDGRFAGSGKVLNASYIQGYIHGSAVWQFCMNSQLQIFSRYYFQ